MHLRLARMRDRVAAELDVGTVAATEVSTPVSSFITSQNPGWRGRRMQTTEDEDKRVKTHFLLMKYRSALPSVWSSFSIWKDVACEDAPGS